MSKQGQSRPEAGNQPGAKLDRVGWLEGHGCQFRQFQSFEVRAAEGSPEDPESGALYVEGVATPFNTPTVLYSFDGVDYKEQIDAGAFEGADLSDVIFNYNHGGKVVARTRNGTLQLSVETDGLHIRARLDGTEEGRKLYEEIKGGYIDRMSFAFVVALDEYDVAQHLRTVKKVQKVYDVSAVDIPAYDTTSISARNSFSVEIEKEKNAAVAASLRREILQEEINQTIKLYGGNEI